MRRLLLAALAAAAALPATAQPSFDCRRATTAVEIAICQSAELSALDREMAAAYLRVGGAPGIAAGQRAWLARRNRECDELAFWRDRPACLARLYMERLEELRAVK